MAATRSGSSRRGARSAAAPVVPERPLFHTLNLFADDTDSTPETGQLSLLVLLDRLDAPESVDAVMSREVFVAAPELAPPSGVDASLPTPRRRT